MAVIVCKSRQRRYNGIPNLIPWCGLVGQCHNTMRWSPEEKLLHYIAICPGEYTHGHSLASAHANKNTHARTHRHTHRQTHTDRQTDRQTAL